MEKIIGYSIFLAALLALVINCILQRNKRRQGKLLSERKMPSGRILPKNDEEILHYRKEDLVKWDDNDLKFFINYVGHRCAKCNHESPEYKLWGDLFTEASRALYKY